MWIWLPVPLLYLSLVLLLRAEGRRPTDERQVKLWKPLATMLVILVCGLSFTRPSSAFDTTYTLLILAGLILSLAGDWLLIFQDDNRAFLAGLVAFLCAHLMYIAAFIYIQITQGLERNRPGEAVVGVALALVGAMFYGLLRSGLGELRGPVVAYILVISVMVHRALAVALVHPGPVTQPALIALGALLFFLSDAILGINRFRFKGQMPHYKLWNLSTYYTGQLLVALSASFFA